MFKALIQKKTHDFIAKVQEVDDDFLPGGDVTLTATHRPWPVRSGGAVRRPSPQVDAHAWTSSVAMPPPTGSHPQPAIARA